MSSMDDIETYLRQAAALHGLVLDDAQLARVAVVFRRNVELARLVTDYPLDTGDESAIEFRPAP